MFFILLPGFIPFFAGMQYIVGQMGMENLYCGVFSSVFL